MLEVSKNRIMLFYRRVPSVGPSVRKKTDTIKSGIKPFMRPDQLLVFGKFNDRTVDGLIDLVIRKALMSAFLITRSINPSTVLSLNFPKTRS